MYFPDSDIKIGIQVKSYNDIEEKDFSTKIIKQIFDSSIHGLSRLVLAFAGDLNNILHSEKVRGLVSRISQRNDSYIIVLIPEAVRKFTWHIKIEFISYSLLCWIIQAAEFYFPKVFKSKKKIQKL